MRPWHFVPAMLRALQVTWRDAGSLAQFTAPALACVAAVDPEEGVAMVRLCALAAARRTKAIGRDPSEQDKADPLNALDKLPPGISRS